MCISSSTPCGFTKSRFCPTWTDQPTRWRAASTAAPTPLWNISRVKSWRCATGRGLYQIDLLNGSKERITEGEYWAAKKGQLALDKENAAREAAGQPTKPTKFETDKAKLRRTIRQALSQAGSFDEFSSLLLREGVTVKESRGRLSTSRRTGQSLSQPESWGTILTRLLSLPCSRRTPTELPNRPKPYPNTLPQLKSRYKGKKLQKPPRQTTPCSAWLTGKPSEPRARAWAMTAGRQSTT